jgi:hypothetical protein
MSDAGGKKIKPCGGIIEYDEPVPDSRAEAVKATVEAGLAAFDAHKETLLAFLRNDYERGPRAEPFDPDASWRDLNSLAGTYFWKARVKQGVLPAAALAARLHELEKAFGTARAMADEAMQNDVGGALRWSWWEGTSKYAEAEGRFVDFLYIEREFEKVVTSLAALEAAAMRAADDVVTRRGRPKGTAILPRDYIEALAAVYRVATGSKPGAGDGPYAKFVMKFLIGLGRRNIEYESVIDAIKDARRWALKRPAATKWGQSPFDEEFDQEQ